MSTLTITIQGLPTRFLEEGLIEKILDSIDNRLELIEWGEDEDMVYCITTEVND